MNNTKASPKNAGKAVPRGTAKATPPKATAASSAKSAPKTKAAETQGLTKLGSPAKFRFESPEPSILEAFPNRYPDKNYVIQFEHPEFTSLCPMTGQPDFGLIRIRYVPGAFCVESKSFKLYMGAFRNHGSFMESLTNKIADDLIQVLQPRRMTVEGIFNVRGGTHISVRVEYLAPKISGAKKDDLLRLW